MFLRQEWTDLRLAHGLDGTLSLKGEEVTRIWLPDTYITNNNEYVLHKDNQLALISKYGDVYFGSRLVTCALIPTSCKPSTYDLFQICVRRLLVVASCRMYLVYFPMDVQKCKLILESCKSPFGRIMLNWSHI